MELAKHFTNITVDVDQVENEWQSLHFVHWSKDCLINTVKFWSEVSWATDASNNPRYGNISKLALSLLSLPFSNATVERLFSSMNVVHSKLRNRLHVRSTEAIQQIRYGLRREKQTCATFQPTAYMIQHFTDRGQNKNDDAGADEGPENIDVEGWSNNAVEAVDI